MSAILRKSGILSVSALLLAWTYFLLIAWMFKNQAALDGWATSDRFNIATMAGILLAGAVFGIYASLEVQRNWFWAAVLNIISLAFVLLSPKGVL